MVSQKGMAAVMTKYTVCWEVKETPYVQEVYGKTDGEDNAYKRTYTRDQAEVVYIDVD